MADISGASLGPIYERLNSAPSYHPLEADTFADWSLEAGDIVTVTRDNKGYQSPVHSSVVTWKKQPQVQISSTGNEQREAVSKISQKKFRNGSGSLRANNYQHIYVEDAYGRMRSGLELTGSSAALYVEDRYRQMKSGLDLTSSSASLYVDSKYNQMKSGLDLTSSSASLYVDSKYNQMKSGLDLTSSSAALYVDSKYNQMKSGLDITMSSATLYARSAENAAEIVARINESTGESEIQLDAQKVYIGNSRSTTVINGKLNASDFTADSISAKLATLAQVVVNGLNVIGDVYVRNGAGSQQNVAAAIWDIQLDGPVNNVYTLKRRRINESDYTDIGTFSRATTLKGDWDSGTYTVTASPQGNTLSTTLQILSPDGSVSRSGKYVSRNFKAYYGPDEDHITDTGFHQTVSIDASSVWDAGQDAKHVDAIRITGNGNRYWDGDTYKQNVGVAADYNTGGSYVTAIAVDVTDAYNTGLDDGWYAYYESDQWESPSASNGWKAKIPTKEDSSKNETWLTLTNYSQWHPSAVYLNCTEKTEVPGTSSYNYTFTVLGGSSTLGTKGSQTVLYY